MEADERKQIVLKRNAKKAEKENLLKQFFLLVSYQWSAKEKKEAKYLLAVTKLQPC